MKKLLSTTLALLPFVISGAQAQMTGLSGEQLAYAENVAHATVLSGRCEIPTTPNFDVLEADLAVWDIELVSANPNESFVTLMMSIVENYHLSEERFAEETACQNLRDLFGDEGTLIPGLAIFLEG